MNAEEKDEGEATFTREAMSTPQDITENVKQAREQALVGMYDEAKVYYSGAIQGIQRMMKDKLEPDLKDKWKQVARSSQVCLLNTTITIYMQALNMLDDELELVKSLTSTLASFKEDPGIAAGARQRSSNAGREDHRAPHSRDPDVWAPPTPLEPRLVRDRGGLFGLYGLNFPSPFSLPSRPAKGVRPTRKSDEHISRPAVSRPVGGGARKQSAPSSARGGPAKVIDSRGGRGGGARGGGAAAGGKRGAQPASKKPSAGKDEVMLLEKWFVPCEKVPYENFMWAVCG